MTATSLRLGVLFIVAFFLQVYGHVAFASASVVNGFRENFDAISSDPAWRSGDNGWTFGSTVGGPGTATGQIIVGGPSAKFGRSTGGTTDNTGVWQALPVATDSGTLEFDVQFTDKAAIGPSGQQRIWISGNMPGDPGYGIVPVVYLNKSSTAGKMRLQLYRGDGTWVDDNAAINLGQWYRFAMRWYGASAAWGLRITTSTGLVVFDELRTYALSGTILSFRYLVWEQRYGPQGAYGLESLDWNLDNITVMSFVEQFDALPGEPVWSTGDNGWIFGSIVGGTDSAIGEVVTGGPGGKYGRAVGGSTDNTGVWHALPASVASGVLEFDAIFLDRPDVGPSGQQRVWVAGGMPADPGYGRVPVVYLNKSSAAGKMRLQISRGDGSWVDDNTSLNLGQWYRFELAWDGSASAWDLTIRDASGSVVFSEPGLYILDGSVNSFQYLLWEQRYGPQGAYGLASLDWNLDTVSSGALPRPLGPAGWYKGNTHAHTSRSPCEGGCDGDVLPSDMYREYDRREYDFAAATDHNACSPAGDFNDPVAGDMLVLRGEELDTIWGPDATTIHVTGLNCTQTVPEGHGAMTPDEESALRARLANLGLTSTQIDEEVLLRKDLAVLQAGTDAVRSQNGIPILNHPYFGRYESLLRRAKRLGLVEIWNFYPSHLPQFPAAEAMWDRLLTDGYRLYAVATDDAHDFDPTTDFNNAAGSVPGQGWVLVNATEKSATAIAAALDRGDFYSSSGVLLSALTLTPTLVTVRVAAQPGRTYRIDFVGSSGQVLAFTEAASASYAPSGTPYVRVRVTDTTDPSDPKPPRAWTQPVFVPARPTLVQTVPSDDAAFPHVGNNMIRLVFDRDVSGAPLPPVTIRQDIVGPDLSAQFDYVLATTNAPNDTILITESGTVMQAGLTYRVQSVTGWSFMFNLDVSVPAP